jgi:hypothetical protein
MRKSFSIVLAVALAGLVGQACSDTTTPLDDQAQVAAAVQDQLGNMMTDSGFGDAGAVSSAAVAGASATFPSLSAGTPAPLFWGRLRVLPGGPRPVVRKDITIINDTASVTLTVTFQGVFLVDTSDDGAFNPTAKPLAESFTQRAVLVRDGGARHRWRPVLLSPMDWKPAAVDRQTVHVTDIKVYTNGALVLDVSNPDSLYDFDRRIPRFHMGDTVKVVAAVTNTTGGSNTPSTYVFLHVRHADPAGMRWARVEMQDNGDGTYERTWVAHRSGRDRFAVDAIDAATLLLGTADNYRANVIGIPYHIE